MAFWVVAVTDQELLQARLCQNEPTRVTGLFIADGLHTQASLLAPQLLWLHYSYPEREQVSSKYLATA